MNNRFQQMWAEIKNLWNHSFHIQDQLADSDMMLQHGPFQPKHNDRCLNMKSAFLQRYEPILIINNVIFRVSTTKGQKSHCKYPVDCNHGNSDIKIPHSHNIAIQTDLTMSLVLSIICALANTEIIVNELNPHIGC